VARKHKPMRTCVGCQTARGKREMIRIVRGADRSVQIDPKGKMAGRGAYLCANRQCWEQALNKGHIERALRTKLSEKDWAMLQAQANKFPNFDTGDQ